MLTKTAIGLALVLVTVSGTLATAKTPGGGEGSRGGMPSRRTGGAPSAVAPAGDPARHVGSRPCLQRLWGTIRRC